MRVQQRTQTLKHIVMSVKRGEAAPAAFQRPYVWDKPEVLALVESLLLHYPIGSFMSWTPASTVDLASVGRERLGPIPLHATPTSRAPAFLLDGQNRLASLAWLMRDPEAELPADLTGHEKAVWLSDDELVLNLGERRPEWVPRSQANTGFRLPASTLFDAHGSKLCRERRDTSWRHLTLSEHDTGVRWFDKVADNCRQAEVPVTHLDDATADEALHAFLHICRTGVPMAEEDFQRAVNWKAAAKQ